MTTKPTTPPKQVKTEPRPAAPAQIPPRNPRPPQDVQANYDKGRRPKVK